MASVRVFPGTNQDAASHFGHLPRVPEGFEWPCWNRTDHLRSEIEFLEKKIGPEVREQDPFLWKNLWGARIEEHRDHIANDPMIPLTFLLQIDLEEIPGTSELTGLPREGILYFFWDLIDEPAGFDPASVGGWAVKYYPKSPKLVVAEPPVAVSKNHGKAVLETMTEIERKPLRFVTEWVLPSCCPRELNPQDVQAREAYEQLAESVKKSDPEHRLMGYASEVQSDPAETAQLASNGVRRSDASTSSSSLEALEAGVQDWQLLLQVDDDDAGLGWGWGDAGRLYFMIRTEDLARQDFSRVWFDAQSC